MSDLEEIKPAQGGTNDVSMPPACQAASRRRSTSFEGASPTTRLALSCRLDARSRPRGDRRPEQPLKDAYLFAGVDHPLRLSRGGSSSYFYERWTSRAT